MVGAKQHYSGISWRAWVVWAMALMFFLLQLFLQLCSGEMIGSVMKTLKLTALQGGWLMSSYYYVAVFLQIPGGVLLDRFGPRRVLTVAAMVMGAGCYCFASASSLVMAVTGRLLMGTGGACSFVGCMAVVTRWFPARYFSVMIAVTECVGFFAAVVGDMGLSWWLPALGWQFFMLLSAVLSLLLAVIMSVGMRDCPIAAKQQYASTLTTLMPAIKRLASNPVAWMNALYGGLIFSLFTVFVGLWSVPFYQVHLQFSLPMATLLSNTLLVGTIMSCPLLGWLEMRISSRRFLMVMTPLLMAFGLWVSFHYVLTPLMHFVLLFFIGLGQSVFIISYVIGKELATPSTRAVGVGLVNMSLWGIPPLLQPLVGALLGQSVTGNGGVVGISVAHYQTALWVIPGALILAALIALVLPNEVMRRQAQ